MAVSGCAKTRSIASNSKFTQSEATGIVGNVGQPQQTQNHFVNEDALETEAGLPISTAPSASFVINGSLREAGEPIVRFVGWQAQSPDEGGNQLVKETASAPTLTDASTNRSNLALAIPTLNPQINETDSVCLTVEACVELALSAHPKVAAARARLSAANSRIPQASALADPKLDNLFFPLQPYAQQFAIGRMQDQVSLSQEVPWPEKLKARAAVAIRESQIAQTEVEAIERDIANGVLRALASGTNSGDRP